MQDDGTRGAPSEPVVVRRRRPDDLPALADLLWAQQKVSRYPFRDPLPIPVEQFLHAHDAAAAWVAEVRGSVAGHACRTPPPHGSPAADDMNRAGAAAHGCAVEELAWVSTLFVDVDLRRAGLGRRLLEVVLDDIDAAGLHPCLEVLPVHAGALRLYESTGWREVLRLQPPWLLEAAGTDGPRVRVLVRPAPRGSRPPPR